MQSAKQLLAMMGVFWLVGCGTATNKMLVLDYGDFGPQASSYELIGFSWWQWDRHGDSRDESCDVKVVVYRDVSLEKVKKAYPVVPTANQDYRYLPYSDAIVYLDARIEDHLVAQVVDTCRETRGRIATAFEQR